MTQLTWLDDRALQFPQSSCALTEPNGLLAAGNQLNTPLLLAAYERGIFPWYEEGQPVLWWTPDPRLVLYPEEINISRSLAKVIRQNRFHVTTDTCFDLVVEACSQPREDGAGTWISQDIKLAYSRLHQLGFAHSVEVWQSDELVGGLYGVSLSPVFFGESMFTRVSNASKVGFAYLVEQLLRLNFRLIDCQVYTNHLASLGAREISRLQFEQHLLDYNVSAKSSGAWF